MSKLSGLPGFVKDPDPSLYWSTNYVVLDFETTNLFKGSPLVEDNRIIMASWRRPDGAVRSHFGSEFDQAELVADINAADFIVAHNAKFELGWLKRCGLDLRSVIVYDTMVGEYVLGGNTYQLTQLSLASSLERYSLAPKGDVVSKMLKAGIPTDSIPNSWLREYCERDVLGAHELFLRQRDRLAESGRIHLQYQRCLLSPALADIEAHGMQLDPAAVDNAIAELEDDYAKLTSELQEFMGGVPPSSVKQKCEYVFGELKFQVPKDWRGKPMLTKSGTPSIAAEVIKKLRPHNNKQQQWLEMHKRWAKMHSDLTKYLRKFRLCCDEADGQLRAVFNQCATRTHRLSSSGLVYKIQFQNLNRLFKPIFTARNKGWLMGEADGAQLEWRIAVHMGRDKQGLADMLDEDFDAHLTSASEMEEIDYAELLERHRAHDSVVGSMRQNAKPETFKPLYGGTSGTPKQQRWYTYFAKRYSGIATAQRTWTHKVLADKKLRTEYGLEFYWPQCEMKRSGYITFTTNIYNYPVQGFATAEIIPIAIICAWHRMKDMQSFLVNTIHDSIIGEVHPEEKELWHELAKQCLIKDSYMILEKLYNVRLTVPLGAGVMLGSHWANKEAKNSETTYDAELKYYEDAARKEGMLDG